MPETLLTPSSIKIFGRILNDLNFNFNPATVTIGANNFLEQQLNANSVTATVNGRTAAGTTTVASVTPTTAGLAPNMNVSSTQVGAFALQTTIASVINSTTFTVNPAATGSYPNIAISASWQIYFARIYAFSFEGALYALPRPSIFLVHGLGTLIDMTPSSQGFRSTLDQSGVIAREWEFSAQTRSDINYWEYEKGDFSLRLDTEAGPFEQILLAAALRAGADMADRSGAQLGVRSGAQLSGAQLSGAQLSGAQLSGAQLSGNRR
jgi:Pentapeptide repeats (8 copies)